MLEIFVSDQKIDLPTDIQFALTIENPFMLQDRIPAPYSLTFELPATARNLKIFNFPDRIASYKSQLGITVSRTCRVLFQSVTIDTGYITLTEFERQIKAAFRGADISGALRESLFETPMDVVNFTGGNYNDPNFDDPTSYAAKYRQFAINGAQRLDDRLVVAPIRVKTENSYPLTFMRSPYEIPSSRSGREWSGSRGRPRNNSGLGRTAPRSTFVMMGEEYFNYYNPAHQEFMLRRDPPLPPNTDMVHAPIFPLLKVHYVLAKLFADRLDNNIFANPELEDLVVPSTYFQNWERLTVELQPSPYEYYPQKGMMFNNKPPFGFNPVLPPGSPPNPFLRLNSFLPASPAPEFIKDIMKLFCMTLVPKAGRFRLVLNKDIVMAPVKLDWNEKLIGHPKISSVEKLVYRYGYEGEQEYLSDNTIQQVATMHEMINDDITPAADGMAEKTYRITATGQVFRKIATFIAADPEDEESEDEVIIVYEPLSMGLGAPITTTSQQFDSVSSLKPLPVNPEQYWWSQANSQEEHPETDWWCVPVWEGDRSQRPETAFLMFYRGLQPSARSGHSYPFLSPYRQSPAGGVTGNLSLSWNGSDGLMENFHKEFRQWVERDKVKVSGSFLLDALDLHKLDITSKVHLKGRTFFIEKLQVTIRHNRIEPALVDLIEA